MWYRPLIPNELLRCMSELMTISLHGLKNKREIWKNQLFLSRIKKVAGMSTLQNQHSKDSRIKRYSIIWFCFKFNIIKFNDTTQNIIAGVNLADVLKRRLQTFIFRIGCARSMHESRMLIMHRYIKFCMLL